MKSTKRVAALGLSLALVLTSICGGTPESVQGATKSVTVSTQKQLDKALKSSKYTKITIKSSAKKTLKVKSGKYTKKQLVVKGSKLTVSNAGQFKAVTITDASKYTEAAKNNKITVSDKKLSLVLDKKASVKSIKITKASAAITISGKCTKVTPVTITGKGTKLTSSVGVKVTASANATITLKKGAEKSTVKVGKNADVKVKNSTKKSIKVTKADGTTVSVKSGKTATVKKPEEEQNPTGSVSINTQIWISVSGNSTVSGNGWVEIGTISGECTVSGNQIVSGNLIVSGNAVSANTIVSGDGVPNAIISFTGKVMNTDGFIEIYTDNSPFNNVVNSVSCMFALGNSENKLTIINGTNEYQGIAFRVSNLYDKEQS